MALVPYPTEIPQDDYQIILDAVAGKVPDPHRAVHACYQTLGYALGKLYPDTASGMLAMAPMEAFPWVALVQMIINLLPQLLALLNVPTPVKS